MNGNKVVLDTSIIIHAFKDNDIAEKLQTYSEIFIPSIAAGELYYGAYRSANVKKHLDQLHKFIQNCTVLSVDLNTANANGKIKNS